MTPSAIAEKAQASPTKVFASPDEVLQAPLSTADKLKILRSWENEAHQLQAATEESMTGGEPSRLDEIRKIIDRLEREEGAA